MSASLERSLAAPLAAANATSAQPSTQAATAAYAIMWIVGGIHEDRPSYKGFLYNVLISARILDRLGSTADRVLWVQLSPDSNRTALGAEDARTLAALLVQVRYLERDAEFESFGLLVYSKFHAIKMVEYKRVMFLDADIIPTVNMDYLFHLSDPAHAPTPTLLRPNLIMATRGEPCNTAFFVVEPSLSRYAALQRAIARQHAAGRALPYPHFSREEGWGHSFKRAGDGWRAIQKTGREWHYHAVHSDQGLMYYYAKYLAMDASIAIGDAMEHWAPPTDGSNEGKDPRMTLPILLSTDEGLLTAHSPAPLVWQHGCGQRPTGDWQCPAPYRNLAHFSGASKPWGKGHNGFAPTESNLGMDAAQRLWFRTLDELSRELSMGLDVKNWNAKHRAQIGAPSLGYLATWKDLAVQVYERQSKTNATTAAAEVANELVPTKIGNAGNNSSRSLLPSRTSTPTQPIKVAYAISVIECTDHHKSGQSSIAGLVDAALVLRHSIHQNSVRNPRSGSKYDYAMYAIVHEQAAACAPRLAAAGFATLVRPPPVREADIRGDFLRKNIRTEVCCGVHEFVKLYAYTLAAPEVHPVVVHLDIDFLVQKPLDPLVDAVLGARDARTRAAVQREDTAAPWPQIVEALWTRDHHSAFGQGRKAGFQAGFWVLKPSEEHFRALLGIIRKGDYVDGFSRQNGWGGLGYGGFIGAKAMQGLIAYYYDVIVPGTSIELNNCRYNAMGASVLKNGACKNGQPTCEDCRDTPVDEIHSFHYTVCRKPWLCIAGRADDKNNTFPRKHSIPTDVARYDHCMQTQKVWHAARSDLEEKLYTLTGDDGIRRDGQRGSYQTQYFAGHCTEDQAEGYLRLGGSPETHKRIPDLYL